MWKFLCQCRVYFAYAGLFSSFINLLLLTVSLYMLQVFDRVLSSRSNETLFMLTLVAGGALLVHLFLDVLRGRLLLAAGMTLEGLAGPPVLAGVLRNAGPAANRGYATGLRDVAVLRGFLTGQGVPALFDPPWVPIYIGVIFLFHPWLGTIASMGALALFLLACLNERLTRRPLDAMNGHSHRAASYIDAGVRNAEVVNVLGMRESLERGWRRLHRKVVDTHLQASGYAEAIAGVTKFTRLAIQVLMLGAGAKLVIEQEVTAGVMVAGTLILARALAPVEAAIMTWKGLVEARGAYRRLDKLLAGRSPTRNGVVLPAPQGRLAAQRAVFAFPGQSQPLIKGISFELQAGESLGLVGPSASGKSTLARLITGLWRPTAGAVRLDGADLSLWPQEQLGPHIGYLPQDVELFAGTVGENIARLGEANPEDIIQAAERAYAHDMILQLPNGYETEIGESGAVLSGGQRQRIALARALFGNPRLIVLDEPNASLDGAGEEALLKAMRDARADGVTLIVVSHRLSLLAQLDKLLVLNKGQVELYGPRAGVVARLEKAKPAPAAAPQLVAGGKV